MTRRCSTSRLRPLLGLSLGLSLGLGLALSGAGCEELLEFGPGTMPTYTGYFASAEIYRALPGGIEFVEKWQMYGWPQPLDRNKDGVINDLDTRLYFSDALQQYIAKNMAPGFSWSYRTLTIVAAPDKKPVGDCTTKCDPPIAYGAPLGAEVVWTNPPADRASVWFQFFYPKGGNDIATPAVRKAVLRFSDRGGYPDMWTGEYNPTTHHLRFSDMYLEVEDFSLPNVDSTLSNVYIQSFGTPFARGNGIPNYDFSTDDSAVFFLNANGIIAGDPGMTQNCFNNESLATIFARQDGSPWLQMIISAEIRNPQGVKVTDVVVQLRVPEGTLWSKHQPYLELKDREANAGLVTLSPDVALDKDNDLDRFLWFEDFEESTEKLLGQGRTLADVPFDLGSHLITVVAYDTRGAYSSATMTLDVVTLPPVAKCQNVTVAADHTCTSPAQIDDGSFDPEGGSLRYEQAPWGPYPLGATAVTLTVSDPDGGSSSCTAQVTVADTTAPVVSCSADIHAVTDAGLCLAKVTFTLPPASDNCTVKSVASTPTSGSAFVKGDTTVSVQATDDANNVGACAFHVVVADNEPPSITCPSSISVNATAPSGAMVAYPAPVVADNCGASATCTAASGGTFAIGTSSVACKADDGSANSDSCAFTVTVKSAAEQMADLITRVQGLTCEKLDPGLRNAMLVKLQAALAAMSIGSTAAACQGLLDFASQVKAQTSKKIVPASEGTSLNNDAARIRAVLGCG